MSLFPTKKQVPGILCPVPYFYFIVIFFGLMNVVGSAGKKLAESIVKEKLAACVNRVPGKNFLLPVCCIHSNVLLLWLVSVVNPF